MISYFRGFFTGVVLVLIVMLSLGNKKRTGKVFSKTYRNRLIKIEDRIGMLEGSVNERFVTVGENFLHLKNKIPITINSEYNYKSLSLINNPFPSENYAENQKVSNNE